MRDNAGSMDYEGFYASILTMLDTLDDGIILISANRLVEYMNRVAEEIFSPMRKGDKDATFIEIVRDYECDSLLRKCIETGQQQAGLIKIRLNNKLLQVNVVPDARKQHYIVVIKDITQRQHLEDIRRDMIANISHEFRTPITSIKLLSETLISQGNIDQPLEQDLLKKICLEADKLAQMTNDLTELAAVQSGRAQLNWVEIDISRMAAVVIERLAAQARMGGVKVNVEVETGLPKITGDSARIESVLMNLVTNAIKFTASGGSILLRVTKDVNDILVSVSDTGIGISAEDLLRIFERFYKVDKSRSGVGSGLGLAISKHIILAHEGRIWAKSEEGRGSTFYFTLPLDKR